MLSVILPSMLMILLSIVSVIGYLICGNNLNWLLNLNLIYETVDRGKKWLVDFNARKTQLVLFHRSNNNGSIDVKMEGLSLRKNHLLRCCSWTSLLNWIGVLTLSQLLKLPPRKLELKSILWGFFLLRLLCISINLSCTHVWNIAVTSGLVLLGATWIVRQATKTNMRDCWSFTCCFSWTLGWSSKCG